MAFYPEPDHEAFVASLYLGILDRSPDPAGFRNHVDLLARGQVTRHQLARAFLRSAESGAASARTAIDAGDLRVYAGYDDDDLALFDRFDTGSVRPAPGFATEWIGSRVRLSSLWRGCGLADDAVLPRPIPCDYHAETIEWVGLLKAVLAAEGGFAAMELGAGHGPWLAAGAAAARARGIAALHVCGVEADPGRFALLRLNMQDNGLSDASRLVQAAVGAVAGQARWPRIADPQNDAGARPLREGNRDDATYLAGRAGGEMIDVRILPFAELLAARTLWDLVHVDVQGTEAELCGACLDDLSRAVRFMVIATHSRRLDGEIMEIFARAGWHLENEKPARIGGSAQASRTDGTQVWRNPAL
jgi:FkbM family methyltransferase